MLVVVGACSLEPCAADDDACAVVPCADDGDACPVDPCAGVEDAVVELGHGVATFEPVADGDALPYTRGLQGGTHIDAGLRIRGLLFAPTSDEAIVEDDLVVVDLQVFDDAGPVAGFTDFAMLFSPTEGSDDIGEVVGVPVIFVQDASALVGGTFELRARVRDRCQHEATATLSFMLVEPGDATTTPETG